MACPNSHRSREPAITLVNDGILISTADKDRIITAKLLALHFVLNILP